MASLSLSINGVAQESAMPASQNSDPPRVRGLRTSIFLWNCYRLWQFLLHVLGMFFIFFRAVVDSVPGLNSNDFEVFWTSVEKFCC